MSASAGFPRQLILFCIVAMFPGCSVDSQEQATDHLSVDQSLVSSVVQNQMAQDDTIGVAVAVVHKGEIVFLDTWGYADQENNVPVTRDTMFRWASISKPLTAITAMQLQEQGQLSLDDTVRDHLPDFPQKDYPIKIHQLMSHTSGMVGDGPVIETNASYDVEYPFENVMLALDKFQETPLIAAPGETFQYSSYGSILLSAVVQQAGQQPFADQVRERVAEPAGMTTLQPDYQRVEIPFRAVGYDRDEETLEITESNDTDITWMLGGAGFISNIEDLALFAIAILDDTLLTQESKEIMWENQRLNNGRETGSGLGFFVAEKGGLLQVSHNGNFEKVRTRLVLYPEIDLGIVMMTNSTWVDPEKTVGRIESTISPRFREDGAE